MTSDLEVRDHELPELVQLVLQRGVALPLLHGLHLELGDGGLHALDVFAEHRVLLLELPRLLPQLFELQLPRLVVVQELLGEDRNVEAVAVLPLRLGHAQLAVAVVKTVPLLPLLYTDNRRSTPSYTGLLFLLGFAFSISCGSGVQILCLILLVLRFQV